MFFKRKSPLTVMIKGDNTIYSGVDLLCGLTFVPSDFLYPLTTTIFLFCTPRVLLFVFAILHLLIFNVRRYLRRQQTPCIV
nr:MAG TPA: hypothetical protein [Caudoviricetes sp.]